MSIEVRVPQLPESVADATLIAWHKQPGESISRDENLVDLETDKVMQKIVREDFASCTVIAVAHRLETIVDFDRVVVMQLGRIIEVGKPQTLLEQTESAFRRLWDA